MTTADPETRADSPGDPVIDARFTVARRSFDVVAGLQLARGEILSLYGPSGAGKTTVLEAIAGDVLLASGCVVIDGRVVNLAPRRPAGRRRRRLAPAPPTRPCDRQVSFVRQPTTLFPHLDVSSNVAYGLPSAGAGAGAHVQAAIAAMGLEGYEGLRPSELSGGQRQRACLARALARPFRGLLLDEPFSALDPRSRAQIASIVRRTVVSQGAAALFVTHDLPEAQSFCDRLAIIDRGEVLREGTASGLVRDPKSRRVAELCGYSNFLPRENGKPGELWALHQDSYVEGAFPDRGVVLTGEVAGVVPSGTRFACLLEVGPAIAVTVLSSSPPPLGCKWRVTSIDPPVVEEVLMAGTKGSNKCQSVATPMTA